MTQLLLKLGELDQIARNKDFCEVPTLQSFHFIRFYSENVLNFPKFLSKDALNKLQNSKEKHVFGNESVHLNGMTDAIDEKKKLLLSEKVQSSKINGIPFWSYNYIKTSQRQILSILATVARHSFV